MAIEVRHDQWALGGVKKLLLGVVGRQGPVNMEWLVSIINRYHALSCRSESRLLLLEYCLRNSSLLLPV